MQLLQKRKGLQKGEIFGEIKKKKIENGHCMLFIKGKRSPKQLTNIQIITARDEAQQIQEQGTIRKRN